MGVVSMEAMACGLPVISSNIHGIPELIEHGKTGFLCEPNDYQKIAEYLEILIKNPGVRKEMGNLGRQKIKKDFNLEKEVGKLISVFNEDGVN
jgi:glycosyltransferase involved in cell wall biosynthesis